MKRFIYDAILIILLVVIGLSLDDSQTYVNKQEELDRFQQEIKNGDTVVHQAGKPVVNQVEDNAAASLAKNASGLIGDVIEGSVRLVSDFFENLVSK